MHIGAIRAASERGTAADEVFDTLHKDILSLRLTPGTKLSEAEVAKRLDVSRQPVREAFIRLGNMQFLQIRPQRATVVRKISDADIHHARFVRTAIEVEVVQRACAAFGGTNGSASGTRIADFKRNLARQERALARDNTDLFHELDYEFHQMLCTAAGCAFVYQTIAATKGHVDRLCMISLRNREERETLFEDHQAIVDCLETGDSARIVKVIRQHLSRLDQVIAAAHLKHPEYFED